MNPDYFLVSSFDPIPQHFLQGVCFQGEDLIIGDGGYQQYRAATGADIQSGQDGSYIVIRTSDAETVIGTDYSGYYKLFLYQRGERWALSNSLIQLARFAAGKNLPVTIDESHLATFFIDGPFGDQVTSLRTSVKEIRLVPSTMEIVIKPTFFGRGITLRQTQTATWIRQHRESYGDALRRYMRLWTGRMATLLQSDLHVRSDLTGGRDSRAVLSLMLAAARQIGEESIQRVNFTSNQGSLDDYRIATAIADKYGLRFMDKGEDRCAPVRLDTARAYEKWKALCLGVYGPVYFPGTQPNPASLSLGGAGGEGHRRFYPDISPRKFIQQRKTFIPSVAHFKKLKRDILEDLAFLAKSSEPSVHPMVLHYRHFRDRCHGGRAPQYGNLLSPLASADLRQASSLCSPEQIDRSQVLADILINANRELAAMPYDTPKKSFDARHFSEALDASDAIRSARRDGRVFAAEEASATPGDFTKEKALNRLLEDFLEHYERMRGSGFFPEKYIENARNIAQDAALNGRFAHPRSGSAVAHVILAGELSRLSN